MDQGSKSGLGRVQGKRPVCCAISKASISIIVVTSSNPYHHYCLCHTHQFSGFNSWFCTQGLLGVIYNVRTEPRLAWQQGKCLTLCCFSLLPPSCPVSRASSSGSWASSTDRSPELAEGRAGRGCGHVPNLFLEGPREGELFRINSPAKVPPAGTKALMIQPQGS